MDMDRTTHLHKTTNNQVTTAAAASSKTPCLLHLNCEADCLERAAAEPHRPATRPQLNHHNHDDIHTRVLYTINDVYKYQTFPSVDDYQRAFTAWQLLFSSPPPIRRLRWLYRHETYTPSPTHSPSTNIRVYLDTGTKQANSKINFRPRPWLQSIALPTRFFPPQCPVRQWPRASKCHRRHRQAAPPKPFFTKTHAQRQKRGPMPVPRTCRVDTIGATGCPS